MHRDAIDEYSGHMRRALESIMQRPVDERAWAQAQLGIAEGGLGLRDPSKHAPAAFLASWRGCQEKCATMVPEFGAKSGIHDRAEADLREEVNPEASLRAPPGKGGQKYLSSLIDAKVKGGLETGPGIDGAYRQHL